jgi:hypothetical protein
MVVKIEINVEICEYLIDFDGTRNRMHNPTIEIIIHPLRERSRGVPLE